jgi:hypothetical protein
VDGPDSWHGLSLCDSSCPNVSGGTPIVQAACREKLAIAVNTATLTIQRTIELKSMCCSHWCVLNVDSTAWQCPPLTVLLQQRKFHP